jgi:hypothetical protein
LGTFNLEDFERMKFTEKVVRMRDLTNKYLNIWVADAGISFLGVYFPALWDLRHLLGIQVFPTTGRKAL